MATDCLPGEDLNPAQTQVTMWTNRRHLRGPQKQNCFTIAAAANVSLAPRSLALRRIQNAPVIPSSFSMWLGGGAAAESEMKVTHEAPSREAAEAMSPNRESTTPGRKEVEKALIESGDREHCKSHTGLISYLNKAGKAGKAPFWCCTCEDHRTANATATGAPFATRDMSISVSLNKCLFGWHFLYLFVEVFVL